MDIDWDNAPEGATHWCGNANKFITADETCEKCIPRPNKPAAPEPMSDDCLAAKIGEIGNQIHNLGCNNQNDEDLSGRLGELAIAIWDLAKHAPTEPAAPEWDGEGLPPAGVECEFYRFPEGKWKRARVVAYDGPVCVVFVASYGYQGSSVSSNFRPIRTKEQRERDELMQYLKLFDGCSIYDIAEAVLSAGYRKQERD